MDTASEATYVRAAEDKTLPAFLPSSLVRIPVESNNFFALADALNSTGKVTSEKTVESA